MEKRAHFVHIFVLNLVRAILVLVFLYSMFNSRIVVEIVSVVAFVFTFFPWLLRTFFKVEIPIGFEIFYLALIYGVLMFGEIHGFFSGLWWWDILIGLTASIVLGLASLSVVYVISKKLGFSNNFVLVGVLIFSFTLTLGIFWETFEFFLDLVVGSGLQKGLIDTMEDVIINMFGALVVALAGGFYLSRGDDYLVSTFFSRLIDKNFSFGGSKTAEDIILELCRRRESEILEFKSSLRTNLHTGESDKKMELGVLKTIVAFLNSKGGNLLIGVSDSGKILGLDSDSFSSDDKMALHLTNLIKVHVGNEFLPFVKFRVVEIDSKKVILVSCRKSKRRVFLRVFGSEEFYVRNGPASVSLQGNSLVDYIEHRFGSLR